MMLVGEAFDKVRKELSAEVGGLGRGAMWALRGNEGRLSDAMKELRNNLIKEHGKLGQAMSLREFLRDLWGYATIDLAEAHFKSWYSWARRNRLEPFKKVAKTLKDHWDGILAYYDN